MIPTESPKQTEYRIKNSQKDVTNDDAKIPPTPINEPNIIALFIANQHFITF